MLSPNDWYTPLAPPVQPPVSPLSNDVTESNLRSAAFEALSASVQFAPTDCYPMVLETTNVMLQRLQACGSMPVSLGWGGALGSFGCASVCLGQLWVRVCVPGVAVLTSDGCVLGVVKALRGLTHHSLPIQINSQDDLRQYAEIVSGLISTIAVRVPKPPFRLAP